MSWLTTTTQSLTTTTQSAVGVPRGRYPTVRDVSAVHTLSTRISVLGHNDEKYKELNGSIVIIIVIIIIITVVVYDKTFLYHNLT